MKNIVILLSCLFTIACQNQNDDAIAVDQQQSSAQITKNTSALQQQLPEQASQQGHEASAEGLAKANEKLSDEGLNTLESADVVSQEETADNQIVSSQEQQSNEFVEEVASSEIDIDEDEVSIEDGEQHGDEEEDSEESHIEHALRHHEEHHDEEECCQESDSHEDDVESEPEHQDGQVDSSDDSHEPEHQDEDNSVEEDSESVENEHVRQH